LTHPIAPYLDTYITNAPYLETPSPLPPTHTLTQAVLTLECWWVMDLKRGVARDSDCWWNTAGHASAMPTTHLQLSCNKKQNKIK